MLCLTSAMQAQTTATDSLFRNFFEQATAFANLYPREKAYLHFDNSSYYVGDTIWFKAYVTLAESRKPSLISKPLYVEMLDQMGHVTQSRIFELKNGECHGQLVLDRGTLSGYYEIRAYTRWMLAFGDGNYFSRTFPIYQAGNGKHFDRTISTYDLNPSMRQRPQSVKKSLAVRFFPEGGSLVKGVPTKVAFKAESRDTANVSLQGAVYSHEGDTLAQLRILHDGMGVFAYTPSGKKDVARVNYNNKVYTFKLPEALEAGYVLNVSSTGRSLVAQVSCNAATPANHLCALVSREGRPLSYRTLPMQPGGKRTFVFRSPDDRGGLFQLSLIDTEGRTVCERFAFMQPAGMAAGQVKGVKKMYMPYEPMQYEVNFTGADGRPLQGTFSVSVRDALRSDYAEYDNNIFTDMLLTSGLKGYIRQPGYYFADTDLHKLQALDALLMVHGWRQYDMSQLTSGRKPELKQMPETGLMLNGQISSTILKREMKNIEVSVLVMESDTISMGTVVTDSAGRFSIPMEQFNGRVGAVFQTRRKGQKRKRDTAVKLDRNFSPDPRAYGYTETHPQWMSKTYWQQLAAQADSAYMDSLLNHMDVKMLDEVEIAAKSRNLRIDQTTQVYEKSVEAYYDIEGIVDEMRDNGKTILTMPDVLEKLDPNFYYNPRNDNCTYRNRTICLIWRNEVLDPTSAWNFWNEVDGVKRLIICQGNDSYSDEVLGKTKISHFDDNTNSGAAARSFDDDFYEYADADKKVMSEDTGSEEDTGTEMPGNINRNIDLTRLGEYALFYLEAKDGITDISMRQKNMRPPHGIRRTFIQGYTRPLDFYTPAYTGAPPAPEEADYRRRTLYWNPSVQTDEQGKAVIQCHNGMYANPVIVQAEMLKDGVPCSVTVMSGDQ